MARNKVKKASALPNNIGKNSTGINEYVKITEVIEYCKCFSDRFVRKRSLCVLSNSLFWLYAPVLKAVALRDILKLIVPLR